MGNHSRLQSKKRKYYNKKKNKKIMANKSYHVKYIIPSLKVKSREHKKSLWKGDYI